MLEEIRISALGVIDDAHLELGPGLTVITGETGAGKTMVVTGLGLLLGARADSGLVRSGARRALVEGRFRIDPGSAAAGLVAELDCELDEDGTLLVSRTVGADGRSRVQVGGRSIPVGTLATLAQELVAVHGQADQFRLLRPAAQRTLLDTFAGVDVAAALAAYTDRYARHREVLAELADVTTHGRERAQEADLLRFGLEEIGAVAPQDDEDADLAAEIERLAHADALRGAARAAHAALLGDPDATDAPDAVGLLAAARTALEGGGAHDPALTDLARRIAEAGFLVADVASELSSYADRVDSDPLRLAAAQERLAAVSRLMRKYDMDGRGVAGVRHWAGAALSRLEALDGDDERLERLAAERDVLAAELATLAVEISTARRAAAERLSAEVGKELAALAMPDARLAVSVTQLPGAEGLEVDMDGVAQRVAFGPAGIDDIELLLAAHTDAPPRPLGRAASGGELSRVMLALEVVVSGGDPVPTFVFDEVDAGVGGRAAVEVGRRLARLATSAQVMVVTHLPQVAAYADRHLVVEKADTGAVTHSGVTLLDDDGRVAELSRMLAGLAESALARGHAEELLHAAAAHRSAMPS